MSAVESFRRLTAEPIDVGLPGPTPLDMARVLWAIRSDPLAYLGQVRSEYGETVAFPTPGPPALLVNDPADVQHVLQGSARNWGKQTVQYSALARVTGSGLLASSEPSWIQHRRLAAPAFHHRRLEAVGQEVHGAAEAAVRSLRRDVLSGRTVDVAPAVLSTALDAVGRALFAADLTGRARELVDASGDAAALVVKLGRSLTPVPAPVPTPLNVRLESVRRRLTRVSRELIAARRAQDNGGEDLLGLLVDSQMSDDEIRDELVTMIIAGHETVAASLMWTLMLLAEHPEAQDRVRAEVAALDGPVSMLRHREQLPWTAAVVSEALRLYPPAWVISRRAVEADVIAGREVPAGTIAIISPWLVHRRPEEWEDALAFRPERFLEGRTPRGAYLPFGIGPRLCIGREFALGEVAIVLSHVVSDFRLSTPAGWSRPHPEAQLAVHPHGAMPLTLTALARAAA